MKYYLFSTLVFLVLFIIYPKVHFEFQPNLMDSWIWDKSGGYGTKSLNSVENPRATLSGYKMNNSYFSFPSLKFIKSEEGFLIDYSLYGEGFYQYKKLGDEVSFFDGSDELFWKKNYSSYPKPGYHSNIIPFVSGDGNIVFIIDKNGNQTGIGQVTGRFATDIGYSYYNDRTLILFSGGEYFLLDDKGNLLIKHNQEDINHIQTYFAKSVAISPNGRIYAIHAQDGESDTITVYTELSKQIYIRTLSSIIPHKIYMSIDDDGSLLYSENNLTYILDKDGDEIAQFKTDTKQVYQANLIKDGLFFLQTGNEIKIVNKEGKMLRDIFLPSNFKPIRFIPGKQVGSFYIESSKDIRQLTLHK